jgi:signal transduction histidine kinase
MGAAGGRRAGANGRRAASPGASASWRDDALRAILNVAALVSPPSAVLAALVREPPRPVLDTVVILAVGLSMPVLRLLRNLPLRVRAGVTGTVMYGAGAFVLARVGLAPGSVLLLVISAMFSGIYFGRTVNYVVVALGGAAFVVIGWLVDHGQLVMPKDVFDPHLFRNWFRVGAIYAMFATLVTSIVSFVIGRVEASASDLRVAYERLGLLHQRLESTKEEERRFLAHELHDELGQILTALKLRIQLRARNPGAAPGPDDDPLVLVDDLIKRVRRMSGDLRPPLLDEVGLLPALRAYLDSQAALSGVAMTLETDEAALGGPDASRLSPELEITCFRIVQEAVTNAIRHAGARDLRVWLDRTPERLALRVRDDGRGFDVEVRLDGAAAAGHLGVVGMRERVRAHGGDFRLRSRPGAGTTIEVELPIGLPMSGPAGAAAVPS